MKVRVRVQNVEPPHELGEEIVVDGDDYDAALATAKARIPAGYVINAILID